MVFFFSFLSFLCSLLDWINAFQKILNSLTLCSLCNLHTEKCSNLKCHNSSSWNKSRPLSPSLKDANSSMVPNVSVCLSRALLPSTCSRPYTLINMSCPGAHENMDSSASPYSGSAHFGGSAGLLSGVLGSSEDPVE